MFLNLKINCPSIILLRCGSYVGDASMSPQPIFLSAACFTRAVVAHEISHALGRVHEHQRRDRDTYVSVNPSHVVHYAMANFDRLNGIYSNGYQPRPAAYDYASAMHYDGSVSFTRNRNPGSRII